MSEKRERGMSVTKKNETEFKGANMLPLIGWQRGHLLFIRKNRMGPTSIHDYFMNRKQ